MARLPRICLPGIAHHIIQRGNNRQDCFRTDKDYGAYLNWLEEYALKYQVAVHAWVFMSNHVHLLLTPKRTNGVSNLIQALGRRYVRYFNTVHNRSGTLWEGRFKSCVIEEEKYLLVCQRYIEMNPVRAGIVDVPGDYLWSSFCANGLGKAMSLWTPHMSYQRLGNSLLERAKVYRGLFRELVDPEDINQIRRASNQGMAVGSERFKREVERLAGRRVIALKRGPKPRG